MKLFSKNINNSHLASSNMIEKLIILEEMEQDKTQNTNTNNNIKESTINNKIDNSYMKLLKSDLFIELVNKNRYFE